MKKNPNDYPMEMLDNHTFQIELQMIRVHHPVLHSLHSSFSEELFIDKSYLDFYNFLRLQSKLNCLFIVTCHDDMNLFRYLRMFKDFNESSMITFSSCSKIWMNWIIDIVINGSFSFLKVNRLSFHLLDIRSQKK